jgi:hypothetical protein
VRSGEGVGVNKLRADYKEPHPESEAQWALGNPTSRNGAKDYAGQTANDKVLEQTGAGAVKEAMGSAADKGEKKAEEDVGADDLRWGKRGEAQEGGGAQRSCSGRGEANLCAHWKHKQREKAAAVGARNLGARRTEREDYLPESGEDEHAAEQAVQ